MSSKKDFSKKPYSAAPSAGPFSTSHLGKSSRPSAVPSRPSIGSTSKITSQKSFQVASRPPPSYRAQDENLTLDDIEEEAQEKSAIKPSRLGSSKLHEP